MAPWKLRELDADPRHDTGADIPEHIHRLAWLLECPVEHILKNPRSYTPRTSGVGDGALGVMDPCKFEE